MLIFQCVHHDVESDCFSWCNSAVMWGYKRNTGPKARYPCSICCLPVRRNQKALLCDLCKLWCHCKCSGVNNEAYLYYQQISHFTWNCSHCITGCLPFHDCSFLTSEDSMVTCFDNNYFSTVSSLVQANNGLCIAHLNYRVFYPIRKR